ncbi:MAG TPA: hypothetical protein GYA11_03195 [Firmicutes bacterium]|jgi:aldehyde:ferredoxin oxidoreductase|nr:hypothetical protein [Bacillota bacterium]
MIGPAGENMVNIARIAHDCRRRAGRCGVMGSKKVKAIVVRGGQFVTIADPERVLAYGKKMFHGCFGKPEFCKWPPSAPPGSHPF